MRKRLFRKTLGAVLILLFGVGLLGMVLGTTEAQAASEKVRLSMGGSNTGTWIYMFSAIMVDTWEEVYPGLGHHAHGDRRNNSQLYAHQESGEMDLAGAATFGDYWAMNGMYFAKSKITNFCSLIPASKAFSHAFTYVDSPVKTLERYGRQKIFISGARASPTSIVNEEIFKSPGSQSPALSIGHPRKRPAW